MNAQSWLRLDQLLQCDASSAKKELQRIFGKVKLKLGIVGEQVGEKRSNEDSFVAVSIILIHGLELYALMDTGSTSNVISP